MFPEIGPSLALLPPGIAVGVVLTLVGVGVWERVTARFSTNRLSEEEMSRRLRDEIWTQLQATKEELEAERDARRKLEARFAELQADFMILQARLAVMEGGGGA